MVRSSGELGAASAIGALVLARLGGALVPTILFPPWPRAAGEASPGHWALSMLQSALDGRLSRTLLPAAALLALGAVAGAFAARRLSRGWDRLTGRHAGLVCGRTRRARRSRLAAPTVPDSPCLLFLTRRAYRSRLAAPTDEAGPRARLGQACRREVCQCALTNSMVEGVPQVCQCGLTNNCEAAPSPSVRMVGGAPKFVSVD
ncbi:hypothetical protein [Dactylosporangium sp. CA-139066]|uniref:hypothetical protein n=1 Tax=Dactylosporangium sp. CA-139066 TaxID=3239930 RepID=UPI003D93F9E6